MKYMEMEISSYIIKMLLDPIFVAQIPQKNIKSQDVAWKPRSSCSMPDTYAEHQVMKPLLLEWELCAMVKRWYMWYGHPSNNGKPNILFL